LPGHHKEGGTHYYPALLKPNNYTVEGCDHPDIDVNNLPLPSVQDYEQKLKYLMGSPNETQYKKHHLETGISKPSIFLGLLPKHRFDVLDLISCTWHHLTFQICLSTFGEEHLIVIKKMINPPGIGQSYKELYGIHMEKRWLIVLHIFPVLLIVHHEILLKRFPVDIKHGSFSFISMDLVQHCYSIFFLKSTGPIFASWFMQCGL
jgi:hypothetical protein